jgi:opacity protein-like surface antigen
MPLRKALFLVVLFSLLAVPGAFAQHEIELTPFGGARFGGVIDTPNNVSVDYLPIKNSWNYGVIADYTIWPQFQAEFEFNHQPTTVDAHIVQTDQTELLSSADIDMFQFGFNFSLKPPDAKLQPFIVGGLGFTHWKADDDLPFSKTFSYNLGLGAKYFFTRHVGLRAEARWSPSRTTSQNEEFCDPYFGCGVVPVSSHAEQGQANIGVIFRFR